jgi:hypothetical protein
MQQDNEKRPSALFFGFAIQKAGLPSSRTGLLPSSPLRTVHESFLSHSSSPSNTSFEETRFRDRKTLVVNPVMAHGMK